MRLNLRRHFSFKENAREGAFSFGIAVGAMNLQIQMGAYFEAEFIEYLAELKKTGHWKTYRYTDEYGHSFYFKSFARFIKEVFVRHPTSTTASILDLNELGFDTYQLLLVRGVDKRLITRFRCLPAEVRELSLGQIRKFDLCSHRLAATRVIKEALATASAS